MPTATTFDPPPAPRRLGQTESDIYSIFEWAHAWYQNVVVNNSLIVRLQSLEERMNAIGALGQLTATISDPPTASEVGLIGDKLNQVISAAAATTAT